MISWDWVLRFHKERQIQYHRNFPNHFREATKVLQSWRFIYEDHQEVYLGEPPQKPLLETKEAILPTNHEASKSSLSWQMDWDDHSRYLLRFEELVKKYARHRLFLVSWSLTEQLWTDTIRNASGGWVVNPFRVFRAMWLLATPEHTLRQEVSFSSPKQWLFPEQLEENCHYLLSLSRLAQPSPQRKPVLLSGRLTADLVWQIYHWVKKHKKILRLPEGWALWDQPYHPHNWLNRHYDDEGSLAQPRILWQENKRYPVRDCFQGYLEGFPSTGNAYRPHLHEPPIALPHALALQGPEVPEEALKAYFPSCYHLIQPIHLRITPRGQIHLWATGWELREGKKHKYFPVLYFKNSLQDCLNNFVSLHPPKSFSHRIPPVGESPLLIRAMNALPI